jgi:hypothetical protein
MHITLTLSPLYAFLACWLMLRGHFGCFLLYLTLLSQQHGLYISSSIIRAQVNRNYSWHEPFLLNTKDITSNETDELRGTWKEAAVGYFNIIPFFVWSTWEIPQKTSAGLESNPVPPKYEAGVRNTNFILAVLLWESWTKETIITENYKLHTNVRALNEICKGHLKGPSPLATTLQWADYHYKAEHNQSYNIRCCIQNALVRGSVRSISVTPRVLFHNFAAVKLFISRLAEWHRL